MISKSELLKWFQNLESYERIETVYSLLLVCLPFECRFLGTCLEELGRHNANDLRIMEARANNVQDIVEEMDVCAKGDPTDFKARRKMALYVALIRACNRTCSYELYRALESWGEYDFDSIIDQDTLLELLLIYTMAANHPVFSFEQQVMCGNILTKIKRNKLVAGDATNSEQRQQQQSPSTHDQVTLQQQQQHQQMPNADSNTFLQPTSQQHQQQAQITMTSSSHQDLLQQHALHPIHATAGQPHHQLVSSQLQMLPQGTIPLLFSQQLPKHLLPTDGHLSNQVNMEGVPPGLPPNIAIPTDSNAMIQQNNAWQIRSFAHPGLPVGIEQLQQPPPPASSPLLSQQSSPASSRATSPNRTPSSSNLHQNMSQQTQMQPMRNITQRMTGSLKGIRRPSAESTPPPMGGQHQQLLSADMVISHNVKQLDDVSENPGIVMPNYIRNGYTRNAQTQQQRMKTGTYIPPHQQHQQQPQQSPVTQQQFIAGNYVNTGMLYNMQNMSIANEMHGTGGTQNPDMGGVSSNMKNVNNASDSGSSNGSCGDVSPPQTPTQQMVTGGSGVIAGLTSFNIYQQKPPNYIKQHMNLQQHQQQQQQQQQQHQQQQQQHRLNGRNVNDKNFSSQQPLFTTNDVIMGTAGQQHQPNSIGGIISSNAVGTVNQNMPTNSVLISSASTIGGAPTVLLQGSQQQQQQAATFNANYPYHPAATAHLAATSRPPPNVPTQMLSHNAPAMAAQSLHGSFRFPMPPNGDMMFAPPYHHQSLAFLPAGGGPPPPPPQSATGQQITIRSSNPNNPASVIVSANMPRTGVQVQQQQQQQQQQQTTLLASANATAPYSTLSICPITGNSTSQKALSCFNCGSQTHTGRDCSEASMEDVTRSRDYKLDYCASETGSTSGSSCSSNCGDQKQSDIFNNFMNSPPPATTPTGTSILQNATSVATASSVGGSSNSNNSSNNCAGGSGIVTSNIK